MIRFKEKYQTLTNNRIIKELLSHQTCVRERENVINDTVEKRGTPSIRDGIEGHQALGMA